LNDRYFVRDFHLRAVVARVGYQITSGATARTYVFVTPLESLKTFDDGLARAPDGPRDPMKGPEPAQIYSSSLIHPMPGFIRIVEFHFLDDFMRLRA
jgi:hypothetical protein